MNFLIIRQKIGFAMSMNRIYRRYILNSHKDNLFVKTNPGISRGKDEHKMCFGQHNNIQKNPYSRLT